MVGLDVHVSGRLTEVGLDVTALGDGALVSLGSTDGVVGLALGVSVKLGRELRRRGNGGSLGRSGRVELADLADVSVRSLQR